MPDWLRLLAVAAGVVVLIAAGAWLYHHLPTLLWTAVLLGLGLTAFMLWYVDRYPEH